MADNDRQPDGRIAFRVEGNLWCAYYAEPHTMDGAIFLASICLSLVQKREIKNRFMQILQDIVGDVLSGNGRKIDRWSFAPAPDHERGGNA